MSVPGHWVFAYGSNMHLADLTNWFVSREHRLELQAAEAAVLYEHRLVWNYYSRARRGGAANVELAGGASVWGAALLVSFSSLHGFDRKEGHPHVYRRRLLPVQLASGRWVGAWTYFVTPRFRQPHFVAPTPHYHSLVVHGARHFSLPEHYRSHLDAIRSH